MRGAEQGSLFRQRPNRDSAMRCAIAPYGAGSGLAVAMTMIVTVVVVRVTVVMPVVITMPMMFVAVVMRMVMPVTMTMMMAVIMPMRAVVFGLERRGHHLGLDAALPEQRRDLRVREHAQ